MTTADKTTHRFQAEVSRVLHLVIHSLYSNPDVFLRELISNASDALDKLRFRAVTEPSLLPEGEKLRIRISFDAKTRTLTLWDNGVGMNADALARELGTVAHSGTRALVEKLEKAQAQNLNLIGQFGVGFYSAYLVADRVEVVSRAAGESQAHRWTSDGAETFTIEPAERESHGTSVVLHLKPNAEYLDTFRLKSLVRRYSDFLDYPIEVVSEKGEVETVNRGKALWQLRPQDVTNEQYEEFYKHLTHDYEPPLAHRHFQVEGTQLFTGLLFIPKRPPFDLFTPDSQHGVRLHVKRVFIMDDCEDLLPRWLRFVRGIVDSEDLPLNVSRELLQDSSIVRVIRKQVTKQVVDLIEQIAKEDAAKYQELWTAYGKVIKEGLHFEPEMKDRLSPLLRFESTNGPGITSFAEYRTRMKPEQKAIYYLLSESRALAEKSPHIEALKKRGFEVLFMTDAVDPFAVEALTEVDGVPLVSATGAELDLEASAAEKDAEDAMGDLRDYLRRVLQDSVSEVRTSRRLTDSPACLVVPEGGLQPYIERLLRATQKGDAPKMKRILELNPTHPVVRNLEALLARDPNSEKLREWADVVFEQALLAEGSPLENPALFASRLTGMLEAVSAAALAQKSS